MIWIIGMAVFLWFTYLISAGLLLIERRIKRMGDKMAEDINALRTALETSKASNDEFRAEVKVQFTQTNQVLGNVQTLLEKIVANPGADFTAEVQLLADEVALNRTAIEELKGDDAAVEKANTDTQGA